MIEEILYRNLQALQGTMGPARVARKSMINSLTAIPVKELEEDERGEKVFVGCHLTDSKADDMT
jgi:hypothetical protein